MMQKHKKIKVDTKQFQRKEKQKKIEFVRAGSNLGRKIFKSNALPTGLNVRRIHNEHHFGNAIIFFTKSKTKQNRSLPLK